MVINPSFELGRTRTQIEAGLVGVIGGNIASIDNIVRETFAIEGAADHASSGPTVAHTSGLIHLRTKGNISTPVRVQNLLVM